MRSNTVQTLLLSTKNLSRRPRRSVLTVAAVALAAATYMLLLSLGQALVREIQATVNMLGSELTLQQAGAGFPEMSWLSRQQIHAFQTLPHVTDSMGLVLTVTRFKDGPHFFVFGGGAAHPRIQGMEILQGRAARPGADEVMFGYRAAQTLELAAGDVVELRRRRLTVVGIFRTGRTLTDRAALMSLGLAQQLFHTGDRANLVFLFLDDVSHRDALQAEIERRFPDVEVSPTDTWTSYYRQVDIVGLFVERLALVALLITGLSVSNVLNINVAERTQEIAVLRAVGWGPGRLAWMVVGEGMTISIVGFVVGVPLAWLVLRALPMLATLGLASEEIPLAAILQGGLLTVLAGAVGSLPALLRALRIEPAAALRAN